MTKRESGFFDLPQFPAYERTCVDPAHEAPTHLHIPSGKGYRHVCRSCGREVILYPSDVWFMA